ADAGCARSAAVLSRKAVDAAFAHVIIGKAPRSVLALTHNRGFGSEMNQKTQWLKELMGTRRNFGVAALSRVRGRRSWRPIPESRRRSRRWNPETGFRPPLLGSLVNDGRRRP